MILDYLLFSIIPHYLSVLGSLVIVGSILYQINSSWKYIINIIKYNVVDSNLIISIIIIQSKGWLSDNNHT